ncbi:hypothetical protein V9W64_10830 [Neisseria leonii]|uniref:Uncharacterized protein n=1 Tax=Neisseria leonii TaxID=2995413 RepID=A0A9X4DZP9_9NEIS|nr:hypothetical protein [Neisseria sp. 51.81]MDD9326736.1 hypothetical protein [Neisseria sp. 51.81]
MKKEFDTGGWTEAELRELVVKLNRHLKAKDPIDLEAELIQHYKRCKESADIAYQSLASGMATAGAAAVLTAATGALKELARLQTDLYNADRVKKLEKCMIAVLKEFGDREELLARFEELLEE